MNPITKTYDADKWQLVPKDIHPISSGYGMSLMVHLVNPPKHPTVVSFDFYQLWWSQLIGAAPQPETLSPWMPIDEFLKAQTYGIVWIKTKDDTRLSDYSVLNPKFIGAITGAQFSIEEIVYVMPLTRPQAPEVGK